MKRPLLAMLLGIGFLSAGCLESNEPRGYPVSASMSAPTRAAAMTIQPAPSADTGSLVALVTDPELQPIANAQVAIHNTDLLLFTGEDGRAVANDLTPGEYNAIASKPGYEAIDTKGRAVQVKAAEITDVKLVLKPIQVLQAQAGYHRMFPFRGFISCGFAGGTIAGVTPVNHNSLCGDQLAPAGQDIRDPNHKSWFRVPIEQIGLAGLVLEGQWTPTTGVTGQELAMFLMYERSCSAVACSIDKTLAKAAGRAPVYNRSLEGADQQLTSKIGKDPAKYPKDIFAATVAHCDPTRCTGAQFVVQQGYDQYVSVFYGAEPPADYRANPAD